MKKLLTALVIIVSLGTIGAVLGVPTFFCTIYKLGAMCVQDFQKGVSAYVSGDYKAAVKWYRKAAEQGNVKAQFNLALMYDDGKGVVQDDNSAVKWYRKAAEQGHASAQLFLGWMYKNGRGVGTDNNSAVKWFRKAAEQGGASAQRNLAWMYRDGKGVIQDNVHAHMWFNIAASNGEIENADAVKGRDILEKSMTAADISKAQGLARACVEKQFKGC